jgi:hypothetical protein
MPLNKSSKSRKAVKSSKNVSKIKKTDLISIINRKKITSSKRSKPLIETKNLGKVPESAKYESNIQFATDDELEYFVNYKITNGPQFVSIPVIPYRHVFLVDIQHNKIMISDWGGKKNREIVDKNSENTGWEQYSDLMNKLESKYNKKIRYYNVDKELYNIAKKFEKEYKGGGCANYIYAWTEKYYPEYSS